MSIFGKHLSPYAMLSISGLLAVSDQAVKWLVQQSMAYGESISVTSIVLIVLIRTNRNKEEAIAYSLILGGATGNLIDRIFRGYVVDSFDFYWRSWHWPAFNLADVVIVLGALLFISVSLLGDKTKPNAKPEESD